MISSSKESAKNYPTPQPPIEGIGRVKPIENNDLNLYGTLWGALHLLPPLFGIRKLHVHLLWIMEGCRTEGLDSVDHLKTSESKRWLSKWSFLAASTWNMFTLKIVSLEALETLLETEDRLMASISFGEYWGPWHASTLCSIQGSMSAQGEEPVQLANNCAGMGWYRLTTNIGQVFLKFCKFPCPRGDRLASWSLLENLEVIVADTPFEEHVLAASQSESSAFFANSGFCGIHLVLSS